MLTRPRIGPLRRIALFLVGVLAGLYSVGTGTAFGWITGLALIIGAFFLVRRWWWRPSTSRR